MKLIDRLILKELLPHFFFGVGLFTTLLFAGGYVFMLTEYAVHGIPLRQVIELTFLFLPQIAVKTLPMGLLLATLLGFGRFSSDWEITALRATGVSLRRIVRPVFWLGLGVSLGALLFNETAVPWATTRANFLKAEILKQLGRTGSQSFAFPQWREGRLDSYVIVAGGRDARTETLYQVTIVKFREKPPYIPQVTAYSDKAIWRANRWQLFNVRWRTPEGESGWFETGTLIPDQDIGIRRTPTQIEAALTEADAKSFRQLRAQIEQYQREQADPKIIRQLRVELYNKLALPLAGLIFALVGAPLGIRPQRTGPATGFALSIAIIFAYWVLARYLIIVGSGGVLHPALASFLPNLLGLLLAVWLLIRKEHLV